MKITVMAIFTILVFAVGFLFYQVCTFMALDENTILRETRTAFKTVPFENEPFSRQEEFKNLAVFMLRHIDEIKNYNRHKEHRKIQLSEGTWNSHYTNDGDCFIMPTFDSIFIRDYIPPYLTDSLLHYSKKLSDDLISGLSICSKQHPENIDSTEGSVSFTLTYDKKHNSNSNYYLNHKLVKNLKYKEHKILNSIYDPGLTKDTLFCDGFVYVISVTPYSGF